MIHGTHNSEFDERNASVKIFINGKFYKREEAKISVFDSGYLVGDGIWEAFRLYKGKLIFANEHLNRLWDGAKYIDLNIPFTKAEIINMVNDTIRENRMYSDCHIRLMITRGIKMTPSQDPRFTISEPNIVIIAEHKKVSSKSKIKGIKLFTSTVRRGAPDYLDPRLNCHSKIHEVQALIQAIKAGADEALMLDINGFVSTCNSTNFFIVKNNEIWTSTGKYCMNGITRKKVIEICQHKNIPCILKDFSLFDVYNAEEAFVTGSFGGITPIREIDGRIIGNGKFGELSHKINNFYLELIEKELLL